MPTVNLPVALDSALQSLSAQCQLSSWDVRGQAKFTTVVIRFHTDTTMSGEQPPARAISHRRKSPSELKPFVWCSDSRVALSGVPGLRLLHVPLLHYCVHGNTFSWYPLFSQSFAMGATEYRRARRYNWTRPVRASTHQVVNLP